MIIGEYIVVKCKPDISEEIINETLSLKIDTTFNVYQQNTISGEIYDVGAKILRKHPYIKNHTHAVFHHLVTRSYNAHTNVFEKNISLYDDFRSDNGEKLFMVTPELLFATGTYDEKTNTFNNAVCYENQLLLQPIEAKEKETKSGIRIIPSQKYYPHVGRMCMHSTTLDVEIGKVLLLKKSADNLIRAFYKNIHKNIPYYALYDWAVLAEIDEEDIEKIQY